MSAKPRVVIYLVAAAIALTGGSIWHNQENGNINGDQWKLKWAQSSKTNRYGLSKAPAAYLNSNRPSKNEVLHLLGPPDREIGDSFLQYDLGQHALAPLFPRDKWWLSISFESGQLFEASRNPD